MLDCRVSIKLLHHLEKVILKGKKKKHQQWCLGLNRKNTSINTIFTHLSSSEINIWTVRCFIIVKLLEGKKNQWLCNGFPAFIPLHRVRGSLSGIHCAQGLRKWRALRRTPASSYPRWNQLSLRPLLVQKNCVSGMDRESSGSVGHEFPVGSDLSYQFTVPASTLGNQTLLLLVARMLVLQAKRWLSHWSPNVQCKGYLSEM